MTQVAFIAKGEQWQPALVSEIKAGDRFYIVVDGVASDVKRAAGDARSVSVDGELVWGVDDEN